MDKICIINLTLDTTGVFNDELKVSEYEISRETNAKIYYYYIEGLEASKMKNKLNIVSMDISTDKIMLRAFCYSKDKDKYIDEILDKANVELNNALNNMKNLINKLDGMKRG